MSLPAATGGGAEQQLASSDDPHGPCSQTGDLAAERIDEVGVLDSDDAFSVDFLSVVSYDIRSLSIILSVKKAEQPASITGYVHDASGMPIIGATDSISEADSWSVMSNEVRLRMASAWGS